MLVSPTQYCVLLAIAILRSLSSPVYQVCVNLTDPILTDEQRLLMVLMDGYSPHTRPVINASKAVNVKVGITLTQIFDIDERNQVMTTNIWLDQEWEDEKLGWDPKDYGGLTMIRIPCKKLWLPDIVLYNSADDYTNGYMAALAMVASNGTVFWPPIVKLRSTCQIDISYFPFDDQVCYMKLGSWAYDGFQVNLFKRSDNIDLSNYVQNGEWELISVEVRRFEVRYPCCPEPFPDVKFAIHVRRKSLYYMFNILIPCMMLSMLTLLGFWMRPDSGEKVTLGLTVLLAFSVFMLLIAEKIPATSNCVPIIGIYLTVVMALTSLSVIFAVAVSNINNKGLRTDRRISPTFRRFIRFLARVMCINSSYIDKQPNRRSESTGSIRKRSTIRCKYVELATSQVGDAGCNLIDYENGDSAAVTSSPSVQSSRRRRHSSTIANDGEAILARLNLMISRDAERDLLEDVYHEWQEAAEVIDRLLFWIYVLGTAVSSLTLLLFVPLTKSVQVWDRIPNS